MNKLNYFLHVLALIMLSGIISQSVNAGSNQNSVASISGDQYSHTELANGDSLPAGVTKDWLNDLRDENGNKIINDNEIRRSREEPETDALQKKIFSGPGTSYSHFGYSISDAGDVNGDGYDDIIVGAYYFPFPDLNGRAYIYYGGLNMNTVPDVIITGENNDDQFGISVSGAGDMNGDGYDDVIVGAYGFSSGTGRAYIYFGSANMNNTADVIFNGQSGGDFFGYSVSKAGDFNGDGYGDVIVGAQNYDAYGYTGRVYLFLGGLTVDTVADFVVTGEGTLNFFGYSVSDAGDVNGDGFSDIIVGAYSISKAYIYYGSTALDTVPDLTLSYELYTNFGESVSSAGDVNGDGFGDVIVGTSTYNGFGGAFIFFGGASMNNNYDLVLGGFEWSSNFGRSVSSAGDINGDGFSDVVVGAGHSGIGLRGKLYVYFGGFLMNNVADITMEGESDYEYLGNSVSSAGDVNGDGYSDVIAGAHGFSLNTGRVYLYDYFMKGEIMSDITMTGETANTFFGISVSSAGDVNGDGYSDIIVGADQYSSGTGRAYIYFGGSSMNNVADVTMTGEVDGNHFGISVSSAGDVNGDGYSDVIVGASYYSFDTGRAYIYFGGSSMNNVADVTMTGEVDGNHFGTSVSLAGDVNGDGYSDVIVGASSYSSFTGRAYVYFGGPEVNNVADLTMTGEEAYSIFGTSVSSAGDVNGDGYSDIVVGADAYSSATGRSYIFLGSAISAKPILIFVKDVPNDQGGKVNLKWARSSFDVAGSNSILNYAVYRSYPPVGGNFSWEEIYSMTSSNHSFYTYTASTPYDSGSGNTGNLFYKIRARTSNAGVYWESAILSGRSIDNIAPLMVSPFTAAPVVNNVLLNWKRSASPDLLNYVLYRSTSLTIDPDTEPVFATTTDSTYLDTAPLSGVYYYFIVAQDIHNNKSPVAVAESPNMILNLTMFIEGFYNAGSNSQVSDTVQVELRNSASPFAVADQSKAVVSANGTVQLTFGNAANGSYYIALKHRSSIETWSAGTISLSRTTPASYDMSASSSQAFGSNLIQIDASPVRFAIFGGDINQDGTVDATDVSTIDNDAQNFVSGYVVTDLTGDDFVDGTDFAIADNNAANFVSAVRP